MIISTDSLKNRHYLLEVFCNYSDEQYDLIHSVIKDKSSSIKVAKIKEIKESLLMVLNSKNVDSLSLEDLKAKYPLNLNEEYLNEVVTV